MLKNICLFIFSSSLLIACSSHKQSIDKSRSAPYKTIGRIERLNPELDALMDTSTSIEIIAKGFSWSEGPVWVTQLNAVLFSDVPTNTLYKWTEEMGKEIYLKPSGSTGAAPHSLDQGSNGLTISSDGSLILCQHGDRRVAQLNSSIENPSPEYLTVANTYNGKRFNSPNDLVISSTGEIYFTDPPYGLKGRESDPLKEISFNGVYKMELDSTITLLDSTLTRPNGIALSPDEKTLYVANSDPKNAIWVAYDVSDTGVTNKHLFFDATDKVAGLEGLPDGMKVDSSGNIYASGPGGVLIFNKEGTHLGTILTEVPTANCALNEDETILYMTSQKYLTRVRLK